MIRHTDLQQLALGRLREAEALFAAREYDGCIYLCGYVLEMALKACICKTLRLAEYPEREAKSAFMTHDFETLVLLAGLRDELQQRLQAGLFFDSN